MNKLDVMARLYSLAYAQLGYELESIKEVKEEDHEEGSEEKGKA